MRVIRKYPNRRLYDTEAGGFIKLADLRGLIESGVDVRVEEKNGGADITRELLLQVIAEAETDSAPILSERLLLDLIRFHRHPLHELMTPYLERSVAVFMEQIEQVQSRFGALMDSGPARAWQTLAESNVAWWQNLQSQMLGGGKRDNDDER